MTTRLARYGAQPSDARLRDTNRRFYDALWNDAQLVEAERFNTWPMVQSLLTPVQRRLEVAPGLRAHLPLAGTQFIDISGTALAQLQARGASVVLGTVTALPFADAAFELVVALDIVEHVDDDDQALDELARVTSEGGILIVSMPLHAARWTAFDEIVGHRRRYEPALLIEKLADHCWQIQSSAAFGMQPRSSRTLNLGLWFLTHQRRRAMWWYNRIFVPLAVRFQSKLALHPGMIDAKSVDELLLVCRRIQEPGAR